jgi:hypothetical protein
MGVSSLMAWLLCWRVDQGAYFNKPKPPFGLGVFIHPVRVATVFTSADGLMTYLSPWVLKAGQWGTRIRPHPKFNHLID